jgi:hypothetical protein
VPFGSTFALASVRSSVDLFGRVAGNRVDLDPCRDPVRPARERERERAALEPNNVLRGGVHAAGKRDRAVDREQQAIGAVIVIGGHRDADGEAAAERLEGDVPSRSARA